MSNAVEAQSEAERRYPFDAPDPYRSDSDSLTRSVFVQGQRTGWIDHAEWQASRKVEVTTDMVERAASAAWNSLLGIEWVEATERSANDYREAARAALSAALGSAD